jgi:hypothetical protein
MFVHIKSTSGKWFLTAQSQEDWFSLQYPEKNKRNEEGSASASYLVTVAQVPHNNNTKIKEERMAL